MEGYTPICFVTGADTGASGRSYHLQLKLLIRTMEGNTPIFCKSGHQRIRRGGEGVLLPVTEFNHHKWREILLFVAGVDTGGWVLPSRHLELKSRPPLNLRPHNNRASTLPLCCGFPIRSE